MTDGNFQDMQQDNQQIELQATLEEALKKAQEVADQLKSDRAVSDETLHETFTL